MSPTETNNIIQTIRFGSHETILRLATPSDVPELRLLINKAYRELSDKGLNYTGTYQDEDTTAKRISQGQAFVLELKNKIIATILLQEKNYITNRKTAYLNQLAVDPDYKKMGLGALLMEYCENLAIKDGYEGAQLDTAQPATHLVEWYLRRGYKIVGETHWEGKTYKSYFFEKLF